MITSEEEARGFVAQYADAAAMERLDHFADALIKENQTQNLISKPSEAQIWQRHIADSVQLLRFVPRETLEGGVPESKWLDLGTGAGFPGIVIAAIAPKLPIFLVESRKRRVEWLERIADEMSLSQCLTLGSRLKLIDPFPVQFISARAFAPLPKLLHLSASFSTSSTRFLLPKGRSAAQELRELPESRRKMFHVEQSLTDSEAGIIVSN
ncbi:MAG: 16S rRNA (guanine(527)-N(7))-methyltransferase RsmG [Erythrobacter sp.]